MCIHLHVKLMWDTNKLAISKLITCRDVPIWNFANNLITDCCIKLSADTDTNIDAYVLSLSFHAILL